MRKSLFSCVLSISAASLIASCGGGGGGGTTTSTLQGQFVDAPVAGLEYSTSSGITGVTDADGYFSYREGDTVTFKIGKITLGDAKADKVVTPSTLFADELANGNLNLTTLQDKVKQVVALLLLLDNNPNDDKIEIPEEIKSKLDNIDVEIDFEKDDLTNANVKVDLDDDGQEEDLGQEIVNKETEAEKHYSGTLYSMLGESLKKLNGKKIHFEKHVGDSVKIDCYSCTLSYDENNPDTFSFSCDNGDSDTPSIIKDTTDGSVYLEEGDGNRNLLISVSDDKICFIPYDLQNGYTCIVEGSSPNSCKYDVKDYTHLISGKVEGVEIDDKTKIRIVPSNHWVEGDYNGIVCDLNDAGTTIGLFGERCVLYADENDFNSSNECQVIVFEDENYNWRFDKEEDDKVKLNTTINCAQIKDIILKP